MTQSANARHGVGIRISRYVETLRRVVLKRDFCDDHVWTRFFPLRTRPGWG